MPRLHAMFALVMLLMSSAACASARPTPWLRLHGSNTIGQRLAPALARAFAEQEGWRVVSQSVTRTDETTIVIARDRQQATIEIAAHGTGTGLDALLDDRADLWMASRPVSDAELKRANALGPLDHPTQEHVIA